MNEALDNLLSKLQGVRESAGSWQALCPAHEDHEPSLSVREGKDGNVLLCCHAGCETEDIMAAIGLKMSDLFSQNRPAESLAQQRETVEVYDYTDEAGNLLYQVVRYAPKDFRQRRPDGMGGWMWNLNSTKPVLYRLPRAREAAMAGETVFIPEGEKDVHTLENLGLTATTNSGGAGKWRNAYAQSLRGASVVVLPDNDMAGHEHGQKVAQSLQGIAASVKVVELPGLPKKADVSDWVKAGHGKEELLALVEAAPQWKPGSTPEPDTGKTFPMTDLGNAERLTAAHGNDLRYVPAWGKWLIWQEGRFRIDDTLEVQRRAKDTVRSIYNEAGNATGEQERKQMASWALQSESGHRLAEMVRLAQSGVTVTPSQLDTDPFLLCCRNGLLDLRTGELLEPRRDNLVTKQVPVSYNQQSSCPVWEAFLERIMPDESMREYVQKAAGYTLTADVSEQCLFFLYGEGKNGKSTFIETLSSLMGDYFTKARSDTLMLKRSAGIPNDVAALFGSRLVTLSEISSGQRLDEGLVKDLTGGDTIAARFLHAEMFNFRAGFKLWLYGNHKPTIRGKDEGIWRRIRLVPFVVQIPSAEMDRRLAEKLQRELPGVLAWAVRGCLKWQSEGLHEPEAILDAVNEYRREQDGLADFIERHCSFDRAATVTKKDLWTAYTAWADDSGEEAFESQRQFNEEIRQRPGVKEGRGTGNAAIWKGVGLTTGFHSGPGVTEVIGITDNPVLF